MKKCLIITLSIIAILFLSCSGQSKNDRNPKLIFSDVPVRPDIKEIIDSIELGNYVSVYERVGAGGQISPAWQHYQELKKNATADELTSLTKHKNAAVRCYAFQALAVKQSNKLFSIVLDHLYDTAQVVTVSGCMVAKEMAGDYFIKIVTPKLIDLAAHKLTIEQRKKLDDILKSDDQITLYARESALHNLH